jgi:hypothetical protein
MAMFAWPGTTVQPARPPTMQAAGVQPPNWQAFWTVCVWCDFGSQDLKLEAERVASELRATGLPAAVLWSGDYQSLSPGYWRYNRKLWISAGLRSAAYPPGC